MGLTSPLLSLQRLNSQFGTAVVLTSTWVELFSGKKARIAEKLDPCRRQDDGGAELTIEAL
jgi:hypothetical protein